MAAPSGIFYCTDGRRTLDQANDDDDDDDAAAARSGPTMLSRQRGGRDPKRERRQENCYRLFLYLANPEKMPRNFQRQLPNTSTEHS